MCIIHRELTCHEVSRLKKKYRANPQTTVPDII